MLKKIKHLVLGQSLRSDALDHEKFSVIWTGKQVKGLPFFGMRQEKYISGGPEALFATACP